MKIVETPKSRSLEAEFSNEVAVPFADAFGVFVAGHLMARQGARRTPDKNGSGVRVDGQIALPEPGIEAENVISGKLTVPEVSVSLSEYGGVEKLMAEIDRSAHPGIFDASGVRDQSLRLLWIVKQRFGIDGLTAVEIEKLLREKFRLPATPQAVHSAFDRVRHLVDRVPAEKGSYRYRLMDAGEAYLADPDASRAAGGPRRRPTRRQTTRGASGGGDTSSEATSVKSAPDREKRAKPAQGRPGAKKALSDLAVNGFFASPRVTGDVQEHLEHRLGYRYKSSELSPAFLRLTREGVLKRDKRPADGQYEYSVA